MNRLLKRAMAALVPSGLVVFALVSPAFAQHRMSVGEYYGAGPEGTIGRGTDRLPGGPSDWGGTGFPPANMPYYDQSRAAGSLSTTRPYLTNQFYTPGDGYRYPLYFNPATRSYFYYPVGRR